ncbi:hypothetical protein BD324DRAFT_618264 [Kockovaella imperatae]|uniref:Rhomboid-type serine protease n=1 Tax=Kockovaella imperatae TaxID=4999 RepID=A0A1Y1UM05_9TREE|nr:hypothetical protein BD324DRAFT_618264 [Kockovaella imperatae]ORX39022.1 hypothetical protein BD324DRAFT_618264 [Kockovaella imperatae]
MQGQGTAQPLGIPSHHYPSTASSDPASQPSYDQSYPHASSLSSGTLLLEPSSSSHPRSDGLTTAQRVKEGYRQSLPAGPPLPISRSTHFPEYTASTPSGQMSALPNARPYHGAGPQGYTEELNSNAHYDQRRDQGYPDDESYRDSDQIHRRTSMSIGPWDSASQRSEVASSVHHMTLPAPTTVPLSGAPSHLKNKGSFAPSMGGLSYIDEEGQYYRSDSKRPASMLLSNTNKADDLEMRGLVRGAGPMGEYEDGMGGRKVHFPHYDGSPMPYVPFDASGTDQWKEPGGLYETLLFSLGLDRLLALFGKRVGKFPLEQAIERKRRGLGGQRWPVATYTLTIIMTGLMIYELVRNNSLTGSPIATKPNFNYMIGPTPEVLINIGARFPPCMKLVPDIPPDFQLPCLSDTADPPTTSCTVEEICGHGGFGGQTPDQSWRFVLPIFLHVGIIHLLVNMLGQVIVGSLIEREMGTVPFLIVYVAGGIYGFILGGNFVRTGIPSLGASGALFAIQGCIVVDLAMHWKYEERPKLKAFLLFIEFAIGVAIGYIPYAVDGLAHLGGFAMGILAGTVLYPSISETKRHRYIIWSARVVAIVLIILAFVLTTKNFYTTDPNAACRWCRFLSCIPTSANNQCTGTGLTTISSADVPTRRGWMEL